MPTTDFLEAEGHREVSPLPVVNIKRMTFPEAMAEVIAGSKVSKDDWGFGYFGYMTKGFLMLRKPDEKDYYWQVSEEDLLADDYFIIL